MFISGKTPSKTAAQKRVSKVARAKPKRLIDLEKPNQPYEVYRQGPSFNRSARPRS